MSLREQIDLIQQTLEAMGVQKLPSWQRHSARLAFDHLTIARALLKEIAPPTSYETSRR